jgi:hypothetical protein
MSNLMWSASTENSQIRELLRRRELDRHTRRYEINRTCEPGLAMQLGRRSYVRQQKWTSLCRMNAQISHSRSLKWNESEYSISSSASRPSHIDAHSAKAVRMEGIKLFRRNQVRGIQAWHDCQKI